MSDTETAPTFKADAIGTTGDPVEFEVTRERIAAYAAATNDPIAAARRRRARAARVRDRARLPGRRDGDACRSIPGELLGAILHGEQDFHYHRPIEPGMTLSTTATPIGMRQRSSGVTVVTRAETREPAASSCVEQYMTTFVRGAQGAEDVGDEAPPHRFDESLREREPDAEVAQTYDADQTFRYAEASGDPMQIHLDEEFAKSVGLPGIIIHGLCTMAFTSVAAIEHACPDDPTRLKRLAVRFASIALPEQTITTRIWDTGDGALRLRDDLRRRRVVIKDGLAEVA